MPQLPEHVHSTDKQCWGSSPWPALMKLTKAPVTTAMPWAWRPSCRRSRSNHLNAVSHEIEPKKRMSFIAIRGKKTAPTRMTPRFTIHATDGQAGSASGGKFCRLAWSKDQRPTEHFQAQAPISEPPWVPSHYWPIHESRNTVDWQIDVRGVALDESNQVNRGRFMIPTNGSDLSIKAICERERGALNTHPVAASACRKAKTDLELPCALCRPAPRSSQPNFGRATLWSQLSRTVFLVRFIID